MIFKLHILNETTGETHIIQMESLDTNLGRGWAELLKEAIDNNHYCCEPERIYSLNDSWNNDIILNKIKAYIKLIPDDVQFDGVLNQSNMNYLHKFFEDYMRKDKKNDLFNTYSGEVQLAIREMNILIHRYESKSGPKKIIYSFSNRPTRKMTPAERSEFGWDNAAGDVLLKYCHHGKKIEDIYKDKENTWRHVGEKNIIPQFNISSDFKVYFNQPPHATHKDKFIEWLKYNPQYNFKDTGQGKAGRVIGDPAEIAKRIYGITKILKVTYD